SSGWGEKRRRGGGEGARQACRSGAALHRGVQPLGPRRRHVVHGRGRRLRRVQRHGQPRQSGHPRGVRAAVPRRLRKAALPYGRPLRRRGRGESADPLALHARDEEGASGVARARHSPRRERPHHREADLREGEGAAPGGQDMTSTTSVQRVAVALFEGFTVLDVYGPVQAFASCRVLQPDGKRRPFFEVFSMAAEAGRVKAGEGPASWAEWSFEKAPDYDILLIPGGFGTRAAVADQGFVGRPPAGRRRGPRGPGSRRPRVTTTVCTGSALLARTGLLDGRPATSNKIAWDWVTQQGPKVLWKRKARWVDDGNIVTSSGVSAGIDMALALIERLHGREMALTSARNMEYVWREGAEDDPFA